MWLLFLLIGLIVLGVLAWWVARYQVPARTARRERRQRGA